VELLTGWGRTAPTAAEVARPSAPAEVGDAVGSMPARGLIPRGLGRSYGDAAQCAGGLVIDATGLDRIRHADPATGEITVDAAVRMLPVETTRMRVDTERANDLDDVLARMERSDHLYQYSVAWIDCLARGRSLGRSVLTRGDHARVEDLPPRQRPTALDFAPSILVEA